MCPPLLHPLRTNLRVSLREIRGCETLKLFGSFPYGRTATVQSLPGGGPMCPPLLYPLRTNLRVSLREIRGCETLKLFGSFPYGRTATVQSLSVCTSGRLEPAEFAEA